MSTNDLNFETTAIRAGLIPDPTTGAIVTPIFQTSTYIQQDVGVFNGYDYSRSDNPTRTALQSGLADLEGAKHGLAFSSGMAAIDTVLRLVPPGSHVLSSNDVYGGTFRLFDKVLTGYGIEFEFIDMGAVENVEQHVRDNTRLLWLETPTNPLLKICDIEALSQIAHQHDILVAVDNTFCSPAVQQPLSLGADIVVHSTTKYIGGHSDVVGGAIVTSDDDLYGRLKFLQNAIGAVPGPFDCFLTLRGIKTLAVRMERHSENALKVAQWLSDHEAIERVVYPYLDSHPQHDIAKKQMRLGGGMISVVVKGDGETARQIANKTKLFALAESLGGVESLIELPAPMTHASVADSPLAVPANLIRLSVGIEHADDLIADLQQAIAQAR